MKDLEIMLLNHLDFLKKLFLSGNSDPDKNKKVILYITLAYCLSVCARLIILFDITDRSDFFLNNKIIPIWTNDAGLYGYYAKEIIGGNYFPIDSNYFLGHLGAFFCKTFGFDLNDFIFYSPAFFASTIVVPIVLTGSVYGIPLVGFFASIFAANGFNYYYRTHLGYFDTDMLIFPIFFFIIYFMVGFLKTKHFAYIIAAGFFILGLMGTYHSSKPLVLGLLLSFIFWVLVFENKNINNYFAIIILMIFLLPINIIIKISLVYIIYFLYNKNLNNLIKILSNNKNIIIIFLLLSIICGIYYLLFYADFHHRILDYIYKKDLIYITDSSNNIIQIQNMLPFVDESKTINIQIAIKYMSENIYIFLFSLAGIIILSIKEKTFILFFLPLVAGLLSVYTGARFTIFAIAPLMMGMSYLTFFIWKNIKDFNKPLLFLSTGIVIAITTFGIFLCSKNIVDYNKNLRPVFLKDDVDILKKLSIKAEKKDYILSWWDYAWPIWYFTSLNTLIDNGKFDIDSFLISRILFSKNETFVANASRYFFEKYNNLPKGSYVLSEEAKTKDIKKLLSDLEKEDFITPQKTFDIYVYFNEHILDRLHIVSKFGKLEGEEDNIKYLEHTGYSKPYNIDKDRYIYGVNFTIDKKKGLKIDNFGKAQSISKMFFIKNSGEILEFNYDSKSDINIISYKNRYILAIGKEELNLFIIKLILKKTKTLTQIEEASRSSIYRLSK